MTSELFFIFTLDNLDDLSQIKAKLFEEYSVFYRKGGLAMMLSGSINQSLAYNLNNIEGINI